MVDFVTLENKTFPSFSFPCSAIIDSQDEWPRDSLIRCFGRIFARFAALGVAGLIDFSARLDSFKRWPRCEYRNNGLNSEYLAWSAKMV